MTGGQDRVARVDETKGDATPTGTALKVAIVTPYFRTPPAWIDRCHESVRAQTYPCTHVLVADGEALDSVASHDAIHLALPSNVGDYGDTPRALGSIYAAGLGFDAVAYLDADNWYAPTHIESLVDLHRRTGAVVCTSGRELYTLSGEPMGVDEENDGESFVDTSCLFVTREAFDVFPVWAAMSPQLHALDDRVIWAEILDRGFSRAHTGQPTAGYRTGFRFHYERFGVEVPPDAKSGAEVRAVMELVVDDHHRYHQARGPERPGRVWRYRVKLPRPREKLASSLGLVPGSQRADRESLPDFLCIGAQKAGTTWLYRNLQAHPQVWFPPAAEGEPAYYAKESHFFSDDERFARGLDFYARRFAPGRGRIKGDMTPNYAVIPMERIRAVRDAMPDARLIYMLRNPIERAWSRAMMVLGQQQARKPEAVSDDELFEVLTREDVLINSDYLSVIRNWLQVFPGEQLWIGFLDDVRKRPESVLRDVLAHIGADTEIDFEAFPLRQKAYAGLEPTIRPQHEAFLRGQYHERIEALYERFGVRVANWRVQWPVEPAE